MNYYLEVIKKIKNKDWIIFGASTAGFDVPNFVKKNRGSVLFFCDNDDSKWGDKFNNIIVKSPKKLKNLKKINLIIASSYIMEIKKEIIDYDIHNLCIIPGFGNIGKIHKLFDSRFIKKNRNKIDDVYSLLNDKKSKEIYSLIIKSRLHGDFDLFNKIKSKDMFFDKDVLNLNSNEFFVDVGAYNGDTVLSFVKATKNKYNKIYAYEPNRNNYIKCKNAINIKKLKNTIIKNIGLSDKIENKHFCNKGIESTFIRNSNLNIKTNTLDNIFKLSSKITFIKIHAQGFETKILKGSKKLLENYKPKIAVCINNDPIDLWRIPILLKRYNKEYKIYIRHYSSSCVGTICYAV